MNYLTALRLKEHREALVAAGRGFDALMGLAPVQLQMWELYMGNVWQTDTQNGMGRAQADAVQDDLEKQRKKIMQQGAMIHDCVSNLAVSLGQWS